VVEEAAEVMTGEEDGVGIDDDDDESKDAGS
jgi:hypothetical protein